VVGNNSVNLLDPLGLCTWGDKKSWGYYYSGTDSNGNSWESWGEGGSSGNNNWGDEGGSSNNTDWDNSWNNRNGGGGGGFIPPPHQFTGPITTGGGATDDVGWPTLSTNWAQAAHDFSLMNGGDYGGMAEAVAGSGLLGGPAAAATSGWALGAAAGSVVGNTSINVK